MLHCNWFENPRKIRTCISTATQILVVLKKWSDRSRICIVVLFGGTYDVCVFIPYLADKTSIFEWSCQIEQDHPCSAGSLTLAETPLQAFHTSTYYPVEYHHLSNLSLTSRCREVNFNVSRELTNYIWKSGTRCPVFSWKKGHNRNSRCPLCTTCLS